MKIQLLSLLILLSACGNNQKAEQLAKNLDLPTWKADRGGCQNKRSLLVETLKANKEAIKGLNINDITNLMGKPDFQILASRGQKYYLYCLEPGKHCQDVRSGTDAHTVALRFSALGVVTEVTFQVGRP